MPWAAWDEVVERMRARVGETARAGANSRASLTLRRSAERASRQVTDLTAFPSREAMSARRSARE